MQWSIIGWPYIGKDLYQNDFWGTNIKQKDLLGTYIEKYNLSICKR